MEFECETGNYCGQLNSSCACTKGDICSIYKLLFEYINNWVTLFNDIIIWQLHHLSTLLFPKSDGCSTLVLTKWLVTEGNWYEARSGHLQIDIHDASHNCQRVELLLYYRLITTWALGATCHKEILKWSRTEISAASDDQNVPQMHSNVLLI